jgi:hypothetical protein
MAGSSTPAAAEQISKHRSRMAPDDVVTAISLAVHLGCTRQNIARLTAEGIVERRADGRYDQTASRLKYIRHLRERKRSERSAIDTEVSKRRARLLDLKIARQEREMISMQEHRHVIDTLAGILLTGLGSLPAAMGGNDLIIRRK